MVDGKQVRIPHRYNEDDTKMITAMRMRTCALELIYVIDISSGRNSKGAIPQNHNCKKVFSFKAFQEFWRNSKIADGAGRA